MGFIAAIATSIGVSVGLSATVGTGVAGISAAGIGGGLILGAAGAAVAGAAVAGTLGTVSAVQQAQQQQANAEYQAQIAQRNIELATREETQIAEQGAFEVRQQRLRQEAQIAQGQVTGAAGGVQLGSGSLLDWEISAQEVFDEDIRQLEYDIENRKYQARIGQWNARTVRTQALARADAFGDQIPILAVGGIISTVTNTASATLSVGSGLLKLGEAGSALKSTIAPTPSTFGFGAASQLSFAGGSQFDFNGFKF